jgi:peptide/nickel transport system substrate-binding protein
VVSVLKSLGYKARLNAVEDFDKYFAAVGDSRRKAQVGAAAWIADYASASNFFPQLLTCSSFHPGRADNGNLAEFCDPKIDAEIARARSLQTSDLPAAAELWSKVDHDVVDQAPWIALDNPGGFDFVSRRVGNYQHSPQWGALLDQMWVK